MRFMSSLRALSYVLRGVAVIALLTAASARAAEQPSPFACPASLEPAVAFWKRVYTEVNTSGGFIHDDERLDIVYGVMQFAPGMPQATRSKRIEDEKKRVVAALRKLSQGDDDSLSEAEQKVRAAWPADTSRTEFADAIERVRFQLGQADRFREGLVRSGAWLPEIKKTFVSMGLPTELAALPHVESSFNTYAYSKVGAAGMWQFMRSTGRRYLRIDGVVDERLDPYKATIAAANFLQQNFSVLQSWPLALTAYNHGAGGMLRAKRQLGTDDIGEIVHRYDSKTFGFASRNFYAAFLAALAVDSDPEKYFPGILRDPQDSSQALAVKEYVSMPSLVKNLKLDAGVLKQLNPSLLPSVWTGSKRLPVGYVLRVPSQADASLALNNLPASAVASTQIADKTHRVKKGETLASIAGRYGFSALQLAKLNGLRKPYRVTVGKVLKLPTPAVEPAVAYAAAVPVPKTQTEGAAETKAEVKTEPQPQPNSEPLVSPATMAAAVGLTTTPGVAPGDDDDSAAVATAANEKAEPKSEGEAEALGPNLVPGVQAAASADPADYSVHEGNIITVEASETLSHYADWLEVNPAVLRKLNKLKANTNVMIGRPVKLELSHVTADQFEARRIAYHKQVQEAFFAQYRIVGSDAHVMHKGESIWELSEKIYSVPIWLLRQYNPDVDLANLRPGTQLVIPRVLQINTGDAA
jgi:membrane-bound lytic murein transglycosylase D